jgi:hypothetical protein
MRMSVASVMSQRAGFDLLQVLEVEVHLRRGLFERPAAGLAKRTHANPKAASFSLEPSRCPHQL